MARVDLELGSLYILLAKSSDRAFGLYHEIGGAGGQVTVVARAHPDRLLKEFGIPREDVLWLSSTTGERVINPQSVGILTDTMVRAFEREPGATVIMEGLEYLVTQNDFSKVLKMVNFIYETVAVNQGVMVITIDPQAFTEKELAFLLREAVTVGTKDQLLVQPFSPAARL